MLQRAPVRTTRRSYAGLLVALVVVAVAATTVVVTLRTHLPGPATPTPTIPADMFGDYGEFFDNYGQTLPEKLSVTRVRSLADECASGAMTANKPDYLGADSLGRARGGWVCLMGAPAGVANSKCAAPGTNDWRVANGLPRIEALEHGHLIGKSLNGHGDEIRDGRCVNMTPQTRQQNTLMRSRAENRAKDLAQRSPETAIFYLAVPVYGDRTYVPTSTWVFIISAAAAEAPGPFLNDPNHIQWPGGSAP